MADTATITEAADRTEAKAALEAAAVRSFTTSRVATTVTRQDIARTYKAGLMLDYLTVLAAKPDAVVEWVDGHLRITDGGHVFECTTARRPGTAPAGDTAAAAATLTASGSKGAAGVAIIEVDGDTL